MYVYYTVCSGVIGLDNAGTINIFDDLYYMPHPAHVIIISLFLSCFIFLISFPEQRDETESLSLKGLV